MCDSSTTFRFCTCANDPAQLAEAEFTWELCRLADSSAEPRMVMGKFILPRERLSDELNAQSILQAMNSGNCFDFEYMPQEHDSLEINRSKNPGEFIRLRYMKDKWRTYHMPDVGEWNLLCSGVVKKKVY